MASRDRSSSRSSRSISPVGASRFERPYTPPRSSTRNHSPTTTASLHSMHFSSRQPRHHHSDSVFSHGDTIMHTAPTSPQSTHFSTRQPKQEQYHHHYSDSGFSHRDSTTMQTAPTSPRSTTHHSSHPPRHQPSDSVFSHADTVETAPTSFSISSARASKDGEENVQVVTADDWHARFQSDVELDTTQTDSCPDRATLAAVQNIPIYDEHGNERTFGSVYDPSIASHQRQLIIFVRHFFCGACQAYLQALTTSISPSEYFSIPTPTSIIVIGCGKPDMIAHYKRFTNCPFTIYADPSRSLFKKLGMNISLNFGNQRPEYMRDIKFTTWQAGQLSQVRKELKNPEGIRKRDVLKGGNLLQIGGEFLFEEGQVVWCHRMTNYRDHAEMKIIRKLLELDP